VVSHGDLIFNLVESIVVSIGKVWALPLVLEISIGNDNNDNNNNDNNDDLAPIWDRGILVCGTVMVY
jgi:hypothetical protein